MLASFDTNRSALTLEETLLSKYLLMSFFYVDKNKDEDILKIIIEKNKEDRFLLDSGAFTLFSGGNKDVDFDGYLTRYINFINQYDIKRFIELDIDVIVGYEKVLEMRKRLERETGKKCLPVWHKSRGVESFKKIVKDYNYICIGGLGNREITTKEYPMVKKLVQYANAKGVNVHGLAFTRKDAYEYGFYSVDSSSWSMGVRFAQVHEFVNGGIVSHQRGHGQRASDSKVMRNNYFEWLKYQEYVDRKGRR